jgi:prolyl oligopeptidase
MSLSWGLQSVFSMEAASMRISRLGIAAGCALISASALAQWHYPAAPTSDASDVWFGTRYQDPYRPLENLKDPKVAAWFKAEAQLTDSTIAKIPGRDALVREWLSMDRRTPPRYHEFKFEGGRLFYRKTLGGQNVGKLYVREGWAGSERLLFDPTTYKKAAGTTVSLFEPSFDGQYVVLGLAVQGGEWSELRVLKVEDGQLLPDSIYPAAWWGVNWLPNSREFFYNGSDVTDIKSLDIETNRKARLHALGTPVSQDRDLLSSAATPDLGIEAKEMPQAQVPESAPERLIGSLDTVQPELRLLIASVSDLDQGQVHWKPLVQRADKLVRGVAITPEWVYSITAVDAPHYKMVRARLDSPDWKHAETVIPEAADSIDSMTQSKDYLLVAYTDGINGRLVRHDLVTGTSTEVSLPLKGTVGAKCPDAHSNRCLVTISSWLQPPAVYEVDAATGEVRNSVFTTEVHYPEMADLVVEEVEVPGHDGTMIPLSIIHRKDIKLDGSSPCILEGYGAYGISWNPGFSPRYSIASRGVVVAYAHVRGGSEQGEAWYRAGYKTTKPNTWKDFISATEYLIAKGYTSAERMTGRGTSAGGILITRAVTTRPDLFAAAVVNVGLANAMRAEFSPNGPVNTPEFGTVKDPTEAQALAEMDGLQHVMPGVRYPAILGVGGWNDPRVVPWQPGKFVAAIQQASTSGRPALMLVNFDNGHFTEEKSVTYRNFANQFTFALWQAGMKNYQPKPEQGGGKKP